MVTKFRTRDGQWIVEPVRMSCVAPVSGTTHWGDPQHGDGMYLRARHASHNMLFYAGSDSKDPQQHSIEAFTELGEAGLFDLDTLEELVTFEVPARLADQVQAVLEEVA